MIKIINDDAKNQGGSYDLIFTDPPFEMGGGELHNVLNHFDFDHLLLICSMHQLLDFAKLSDLSFCFDLVVSHVTPKKSKSYQQPHYLHSNIAYFKREGIKSAFDRRRAQRHDQYADEGTHYYPSIFHAPKRDLDYKYQKNQNMVNDLLGAFDVKSVCDPFAGSGSTGLGCLEGGIDDFTLIEKSTDALKIMQQTFDLLGVSYASS